MKTNFKTFLLGVVLTLILFALMGQKNYPNEQVGRYQVVMSNLPGDPFDKPLLVDTQTGRTYRLGSRVTKVWFELNMLEDLPDTLRLGAIKEEIKSR